MCPQKFNPIYTDLQKTRAREKLHRALRPFKMTSSESEYSLGDEEMEAADELMAEDQLEARSQSDVDTEDHTDLV